MIVHDSISGFNMNKHKPSRPQLPVRRFSRGDGVCLANGATGVVSSVLSVEPQGIQYLVAVAGSGDLVHAQQDTLTSKPELNAGKYGGPSRGGAAGGWVGGNNYRQRG